MATPEELDATQRAMEALLHPRDLGNNGKTVSGAGPAVSGPTLNRKTATGNARDASALIKR